MTIISNRWKIIQKYARGKDLLDVGSVGAHGEFFYADLKKIAKSIVGIDLQKPTNNKDILVGNAETYQFKKTFDVVMMGDIIEHTSNQGLLLDNMYNHLRPQGVLIVTTPNLRSKWIFQKQRKDHVLCHVKETLVQILERHHFKIKEFHCYYGNKRYPWFVRPFIINQQFLVVAEKV